MAEVDRQSDLARVAAEEQKIKDLARAEKEREILLKAMAARHRLEQSRVRDE